MFSMSDEPYSAFTRNLMPSCEFLPERVVIWMTPLPARDPYIDDAAAPFTTSTFSISCGLMSCRPPCETTPSMMYNGSWPRPAPLIDCGPRRMMDGAAPGRPLVDTMLAPATLPCSCDSAFEPATGTSACETCATVKASFFTSVAPDTPVTTTWFRRLTSIFISKLCVWVPGESCTFITCG